ncbi:hypothetical protein [Candidatus Williamhamiltonella defendens]|uniref:hypothetical protein n=1 Tax=Candidatus Williamhamiltonella defendens TaxID=138072 RepID=UPI002A4E2B58|nr:hypothetical protein [Candidatus Hamiltonella defensa]
MRPLWRLTGKQSNVLDRDIGISGTEEIYFTIFSLGIDGCIEVTDSRNPIDYNGMQHAQKETRPIRVNTDL